MKESQYEELLNIKTTGEELWSEKIKHNHPYQATSYDALEKLFENYIVNKDDYIVDFGCGKGRLNFYINYFFKSFCIFAKEKNNPFFFPNKVRKYFFSGFNNFYRFSVPWFRNVLRTPFEYNF